MQMTCYQHRYLYINSLTVLTVLAVLTMETVTSVEKGQKSHDILFIQNILVNNMRSYLCSENA